MLEVDKTDQVELSSSEAATDDNAVLRNLMKSRFWFTENEKELLRGVFVRRHIL